MTNQASTRVVSGIQPTGNLHLGNLLGAILRWVRMQDEAECLFFLADLHALTVDIDPAELRSNVREMAAALIASGIDPAKSILFRAKRRPGPCRAVLDPQRNRPHGLAQPDDPVEGQGRQEPRGRIGRSVRLSGAPGRRHPPLSGDPRPVGEDQKQHVELTRDIALKFNNDFDVELFVVPEPFIGGGTTARIMSLARRRRSKMSKSDPSEMSRVHLTDSDDQIAQKIRKAKTDPEPLPDDPAALEGRPEAKNLVGIYAAVTGESIEQVLARFAGQGFGAFKPALADALVALIAPIRERLGELRRDPAELDRILADGAARREARSVPRCSREGEGRRRAHSISRAAR